jgi:hypothetical protein
MILRLLRIIARRETQRRDNLYKAGTRTPRTNPPCILAPLFFYFILALVGDKPVKIHDDERRV